jgi:hypothetical protein
MRRQIAAKRRVASEPHATERPRSAPAVEPSPGSSIPLSTLRGNLTRLRVILSLSSLLVTGCTASHSASPSGGDWAVTAVTQDSVGGDVVHFANGRAFATPLVGMQYLGQIPVRGRAPYLVMAARGCSDCCANLAIYVHSPSEGEMRGEADQPRYAYPGVIMEWEPEAPGDTIAARSRVFLGNCMPSVGAKAIWFTDEREAPGELKPRVTFLYEDGGALHEADLMQPVGSERQDGSFVGLNEVLAQVQRGRCHEVPGFDRAREP